ncbi:MAG: Holliday junction branch migration protein RuvA [Planctomycetota bacterium]|jgi:Holliday junction DNA helicase RuvA
MYEYLRGEIVSRGEAAAVLEVGGVAYRLACSASTLGKLPTRGETKLYVHLLVRDERQELYGFADVAERHLFRQLLLVSGVGPAVAQALLSAYEPAVLASHIAAGELAYLTRVKGVGKRTGERILVELRDRIQKEGTRVAGRRVLGVRGDAVLALCSLGLPRAEAERRVGKVEGDGLPLEEVVRQALR